MPQERLEHNTEHLNTMNPLRICAKDDGRNIRIDEVTFKKAVYLSRKTPHRMKSIEFKKIQLLLWRFSTILKQIYHLKLECFLKLTLKCLNTLKNPFPYFTDAPMKHNIPSYDSDF